MDKDFLSNKKVIVDNDALRDFLDNSEIIDFKKDEVIERQDEHQNHLYLVLDGIIRVVRMTDGVESTIRFLLPGETQISLSDYEQSGCNPFSYITVSNARLLRITYSKLRNLIQQHSSLMQWFNNQLISTLAKLENRFTYMSAPDAPTILGNLYKTRPEIMNQIPPKFLAQYLNIRLETFYRLRSRFVRESDKE